MSSWLLLALSVPASALGNLISLAAWFHFDVEGWWEQRRLAHGKNLDERQLRAAREHGNSRKEGQ